MCEVGTTTTTSSSPLRRGLRRVSKWMSSSQDEVEGLRRMLEEKERIIEELRGELRRLEEARPDTAGERRGVRCGRHVLPLTKKQGVSGESGGDFEEVQKHDKDDRCRRQIESAVLGSDFLRHLEASQVAQMADCMYAQHYPAGATVCREGEVGRHLYVAAEGVLKVRKGGKEIGSLSPGTAFGELAILYDCARTATVEAAEDSAVWAMERKAFRALMMRTGLRKQEDNVRFLRSVPLLKNLKDEALAKMADVLEVDFYPSGEYIIREGDSGDTFFLISKGRVVVTRRRQGRPEDEEEIRHLGAGDYFGERALLNEDKRTANVIAAPPGAECLALDRESFKELIGDLRELQDKQYEYNAVRAKSPEPEQDEFRDISLDDLEVLTTLGVGGFGRVDLVRMRSDSSRAFALKCVQKAEVVAMEQQHHVISEKEVMASCRHPFICRLFRTFKDKKYVYMLMEACLGGEVWTYLRDRGQFDEATARFYCACVVEALEYLHSRHVIYRDLKPENLMLDTRGYVKLVDFGFSCVVSGGRKTWTFCGTPEYVAPEVILNKGHDAAVDFWAIGILVFELLTGMPPFRAPDPVQTYTLILEGVERVDFPPSVPRRPRHLIRALCRREPATRMGNQKGGIHDIRKHKWFQGFHWEGLRSQTLTPPIIPKVSGPTDATHFDTFPRTRESPEEEDSGWDADF